MAVKPLTVDKTQPQPNKTLDMIGYLLFFVTLFTMKNDFDRYHANQTVILVIFAVVLNVVVSFVAWIPLVGWIISLAAWLVQLALVITGMMNVNKLECKPLPVIGNLFQIISY